jgi:hypothetical protein
MVHNWHCATHIVNPSITIRERIVWQFAQARYNNTQYSQEYGGGDGGYECSRMLCLMIQRVVAQKNMD